MKAVVKYLLPIAFAFVMPYCVRGQAKAATDARLRPARRPVVVELFTSEGCSSCPPADRLLMELEEKQPVAGAEIMALGLHVDYWNRLGWKDPFSSEQFSARQSQYAEAFKQTRIYTPQMIVDGGAEFVGSDAARAAAEIERAARVPKARVEIILRDPAADGDAGALHADVRIADLNSTEAVEVWLAVTEGGLSSAVTRGENAGRRLAHAAVVRELRLLTTLEAKTASEHGGHFALPILLGRTPPHARVVIFLQASASRRIVGAASAPGRE